MVMDFSDGQAFAPGMALGESARFAGKPSGERSNIAKSPPFVIPITGRAPLALSGRCPLPMGDIRDHFVRRFLSLWGA